MPDPPDVGLLTRYLFENPWPLAIVIAAAAVIVGISGLRAGMPRRMAGAVALLGVALMVLATGAVVVTAGEQGERVTREFVDAVVANDLVGADNLIADDAGLNVGSPRNPALDRGAITAGLSGFSRAYRVASNRITMLRGYGVEDDEAEVHLGCWTEVQGGYGPTPSQWVINVREQPDGTWEIHRITCISVSGRQPPLERLR